MTHHHGLRRKVASERMSVRIDEAGKKGVTCQVDQYGVWSAQGHDLVSRANGDDHVAAYTQGFGLWQVGVHRQHGSVVEDDVGRWLGRRRRSCRRCRIGGRCRRGRWHAGRRDCW